MLTVSRKGLPLRPLTSVIPLTTQEPGWGSSHPTAGRTSQIASPAQWVPGRVEEASSLQNYIRKGIPRTMASKLSWLFYGTHYKGSQPSPSRASKMVELILEEEKVYLCHGTGFSTHTDLSLLPPGTYVFLCSNGKLQEKE